jgi:CheY-like chemotaxis protein
VIRKLGPPGKAGAFFMVALANDPQQQVNFCDLTLLIVDDNQYMRQLIGHMLRAFEVGNILSVTNANEAFDEIRQTQIDCLIVDWLMPGGMSGIEFVRMLRTSPKSPKPDIPLILCTGHTEKHRIIEARDGRGIGNPDQVTVAQIPDPQAQDGNLPSAPLHYQPRLHGSGPAPAHECQIRRHRTPPQDRAGPE